MRVHFQNRRDFTRVVRWSRRERPTGGQPLHDLVGRHDVVEPPAVGGTDIHVLDEAQDYPAAAEPLRHVDDRVLVGAALDDHVHLHREPGRDRLVDSVQH